MLERWTSAIIRYRLPILALWLIAIIFGIFASANINDRLTTSLTVPGSQSAQADQILAKHFNENVEGTFTVFYKFKNASKPQIQKYTDDILIAAKSIPTSRVLQTKALAGVLFASIGTSFDLPHAALYTKTLRASLADVGLQGALVTGPPAIKSDVTPVLAQDLRNGESVALLIGFLLLILVLGFSWASVVPLILATSIITTTLGFVYILSHKFLMVLYIPNIVELIGLGLAIDYSLLIVQRFRLELRSQDEEPAILRTMNTAGRTVILSGFTVALGLAALLFVPVPFIRSLGIAGILVPLISILATLTLQPVLLSYLGREGVQSFGFKGLLDQKDATKGAIAFVARFVIRKPLVVFLGSITFLAVAIVPIFALHVTPSSLTAIPKNLESAKALALVTNGAGAGAITPTEIIIDLGAGNRIGNANQARMNLAIKISNDSEVFLVANGEKQPYVDTTGRYLRLYVIGKHDLGAPQTQALAKRIQNQYLTGTSFSTGTRFYLGGAPSQGSDLLNKIYSSLPLLIGSILVLVYLILYRAFRSIILPVKAILLDLISVLVAFSVVVAVFQFGVGSTLFGTYHLSQIEAWVLVFLFAILFGLSMDYEVFIVSRMREEWDSGESNNDSVLNGISHTGGVVTAAATILIVAVSGLASGHFAGLQQLGIGLAFGIFIDATIIRMLLLPSAMVLLGKWNWWAPAHTNQK